MKNYETILGDTQRSWERTVENTRLDKLKLSSEIISIIRLYYSIGYNEGTATSLDVMQDIYDNDIALFETIFETDNEGFDD